MKLNPAQVSHGPGLIGAFLNWFLFGIMVAQVYFYLTGYKKDRPWIKLYVLSLLLVACLNSVLNIYWLYTDVVLNFADAVAIGIADWRVATEPGMVAIIAIMVHAYFAWRIKIVTRNIWIPAFIMAAAVISCYGGLATAVSVQASKSYAKLDRFDPNVAIWLISTAICDTIIAVTLTWHMKTQSDLSMDDRFEQLTKLTMQNGALIAVWSIADLAVFLAVPSGAHLAVNLPLAKFYTNSVMSSLNSRGGPSRYDPDSAERRNANTLAVKSRAHPEVMISVEQHEMVDVEIDHEHDGKWSEHSREDSSYKARSVV